MPSIPVDGNLDLQNVSKIVNIPTPTAAGDVPNKAYVDSVATGALPKPEVEAASVGSNVSLTAPGATLDGVTLATGNRILLKDQTTASQNGIWVWNGASSSLTRPTDFSSGSAQQPGTSVFVQGGTASGNLKAVFTMNNTSAVTVDTTGETWVQSNGMADITALAPLAMNGNQISITSPLPIANGGTGASTAAAARTALSATGKFATTIGDSSTTTFPVTHNLGTTDVEVNIYDMATGNWEIVGYSITSTNAISVGPFSAAPATASGSLPGGAGKRVVVIG